MPFTLQAQRLSARISNPGIEEATDADDQFLDLINGMILASPKGPVLNPLAHRVLNQAEITIADSMITGLKQALIEGKASLGRTTGGNIAPTFGTVGHPDEKRLAKSSSYIKIKKHWWGFRIYLSHQCVQDLTAAGTGAAGVLTTCGVSAWVAALVLACVGALAGFDKGKGVTLSFFWSGALIWIHSGKHL